MLIVELDALLERLAPRALAEQGDNCGLQVGSETAEVRRLLVALELTEAVLDEAVAGGYDTILTHHPLFFMPIRSLVDSHPRELLARRLITAHINVLACHTNLDAAPGGLADIAAQALGLTGIEPLRRAPVGWYKFVGFVPEGAVEKVAGAVFAAGAGMIGDYHDCAFAARGEGWFTPLPTAHPAVGRPGVAEKAAELRWETIVPRHRLTAVASAYIGAHPYEEPAFDIYPVEDVMPHAGLGRVGVLIQPLRVSELVRQVASLVETSACSWCGNGERVVRQVGVVPGSGRSLIEPAAGLCDVLITGDLGYHDAERAAELGLSLLAVPHGDFEWWAFRRWADMLRGELKKEGVTVAVSREWRSSWSSSDKDASVAHDSLPAPRMSSILTEVEIAPSTLVRLRIDGGSRGNPGPSAIGIVLEDAEGRVLGTVSRFLGVGTNNQAEYRALLVGLEVAYAEGARVIEVLSDSELLVRQMHGQYRVKNEGLQPLYEEARRLSRNFERISIRHIPREENTEADALVNRALDEASLG